MELAMSVAWMSRIIVLSILVWSTLAKETSEQMMRRKLYDPIFNQGRQNSDTRSLPFKRVTQLYSRNSGRHIRILPNKKIDALGKDGDKYGKLIIESDSFGRVRIRGSATTFYLCIDKRKRLRARVNGRGKQNCIFQEHFAENAFTEFTSVKKSHLYLAFNRRGKQRACNKTRSGMKAVQFIERPLRHLRLYRGRMRNGKLGLDSSKSEYAVCITVKTWREWRRFIKWRKQKRRKEMRRLRKKYRKSSKKSSRKTAKKKLAKKSSRKNSRKSFTPTPLTTTRTNKVK